MTELHEASRTGDLRYDGRFFAAVITTGCYCRPGCGGMPKPENVLFFACAAAAQAAGFRPCRRCRPETSAGTPAWLDSAEAVSRALRLIGEGALDDGDGMESLAGRVGLSARQLRRLFTEHLGASPVEIAVARRAHFARRLIDETSWRMAEIAFAAGFQSVRQFNHAMRETFQETPTELRRRRRRRLRDADGIVLRLPFRPPYDWDGLIAFLGPRATPGVEMVEPNAYRRTVEIDGGAAIVEVTPVPGERYLSLHIESESHHGLIGVVERVRRLFDLGADPLEVSDKLRRSRLLAPLVASRPGLRVAGAWDPFELATRAVLGQQVTVQGATTLAGRLVSRFGTPVETGVPGLTHLFPAPEVLADADLTSIGLPRARADTLRALSRAVAGGSLQLDSPQGLDDAISRLCAVPGIGEWTAQYVAMRAFGEPDAFPASDLGLRRALTANGALPSEAEVQREAEEWRPWRAYAAMYLWTAAKPVGAGLKAACLRQEITA